MQLLTWTLLRVTCCLPLIYSVKFIQFHPFSLPASSVFCGHRDKGYSLDRSKFPNSTLTLLLPFLTNMMWFSTICWHSFQDFSGLKTQSIKPYNWTVVSPEMFYWGGQWAKHLNIISGDLLLSWLVILQIATGMIIPVFTGVHGLKLNGPACGFHHAMNESGFHKSGWTCRGLYMSCLRFLLLHNPCMIKVLAWGQHQNII